MRNTVWMLAILAWSATSAAETLVGSVIGISDGDTITVLDPQKRQHRIRLGGIDAPEKGQAWGQKSKQALSGQVFNQSITVEWHKRDRYGRLIGKVRVNDQDANLAQVSHGLAWHYKKYEREQSPEDRERYATAEIEARNARCGLWSDPNPMSPWDYRKEIRSQGSTTP